MPTANERIEQLSTRVRVSFPKDLYLINEIAIKKKNISTIEAKCLIKLIKALFEEVVLSAGYSDDSIKALTTKFRDAGRRSAPWRPTSSRVPGRPQDGSDGNRINRWLMSEDHKFYANEVDATLVEIKYYLQTLSMINAPVSGTNIRTLFTPWLIKHPLEPGAYIDPVQRIQIDFQSFINDPRLLQSGHLDPLDRDGRHVPENTYLMLARSNQIQGNMKMDELIELMTKIVEDHKNNPFS
ncbi:MAG: hypothetical protein V4536_06235 [Pseudomonadota bacterium]